MQLHSGACRSGRFEFCAENSIVGEKFCIPDTSVAIWTEGDSLKCFYAALVPNRESVTDGRYPGSPLARESVAMLLRLLHCIIETLLHVERRFEQPFLRPAFNY